MSSSMESASTVGGAGAGADAGVSPDYAEIVVVRHGETAWNAAKIMQGHLDPELNETGRQQAILVAERLSKEPEFAAIYSSDLKRAAETAQIIANSCHLLEVVLEPALRERHLGELQGLTFRESASLKPEAYNLFISQKRDQTVPGGGESLDQLSQRCVSFLQKIAAQHKGERVIVVSHGGTMRELYRRAVPNKPLSGKIQNTSVNVFLVSAPNDHWIIEKWGDVSHLHESGILDGAFGGDGKSG